MPHCPHCNSELPDRAKFCPECGGALSFSEPVSFVPEDASGNPEVNSGHHSTNGAARLAFDEWADESTTISPIQDVERKAGRERDMSRRDNRAAPRADRGRADHSPDLGAVIADMPRRGRGSGKRRVNQGAKSSLNTLTKEHTRDESDDGLPRGRKATYATVIATVVIFILLVTLIAWILAAQRREAAPYVFYEGNGELKAANLQEYETIKIGDAASDSGHRDWYYQTVDDGRTLYFVQFDTAETYRLMKADLTALFKQSSSAIPVASNVSGPYFVLRNGSALYTVDQTLFVSEAGEEREIARRVDEYMLSQDEKAVVALKDDGTVVRVDFTQSSLSESVFPQKASKIHWVNEDGSVVYTQDGERQLKQTGETAETILESVDGFMHMTDEGAFYYWKDETVSVSLAEVVTDRNKAADAKMSEPTRPTESAASTVVTSRTIGTADVVDETAGTDSDPLPVEQESPPLAGEGTLSDSVEGYAVGAEASQLPAEPLPGQVSNPETTESGGLFEHSDEPDGQTTRTSYTLPTTTVNPNKLREELQIYHDQMDLYLQKLERDERRLRLEQEVVQLQVSQLWYYDGESSIHIDSGMGRMVAASPDGRTMIYDVSSSVPQNVADVAEVTDLSRLKLDVMSGAERGYRLASDGICSTLAAAGKLSDVTFSKSGKQVSYIYGVANQLTDVHIENNVVFDKVVLDQDVTHYAYNAAEDRLLYYKKNQSEGHDLYENGELLIERVDSARFSSDGVVCLANVNKQTRMGDLMRVAGKYDEPVRVAEGVNRYIVTLDDGVVYLQNGLSADGELRYSTRADRSEPLDKVSGDIELIEAFSQDYVIDYLFDVGSDIILTD
ncbi:MAG: zinc ribbon domain-containing protein [Fastidiosipilaceae bacterium]